MLSVSMWSWLMALMGLSSLAAADPPRVLIPQSSSWALLAWGGAKDTTDGMKVVDVDIDEQANLIPQLVKDGHIVLCYFSVGTAEWWRPDVQANLEAWKAQCVGTMNDWDECWLDIRNLTALQALQGPRFLQAVQQGCHGIEPDNIDCYDNRDCWGHMKNPSEPSGNAVKPNQVEFNNWQVAYAHSLGLAIAMKNAIGLVEEYGGEYDCAINEECLQYDECEPAYKTFTSADKAVFQVEYSTKYGCTTANKDGLQSKYCKGDGDGICNTGSTWTDCFSAQNPLPPTLWTNGTASIN